MKKKTKSKIRVFVCGALTATVILVTVNHYAGYLLKQHDNEFKDEFSEPRFEESFKDTKEVQQYSFDYYGKEITIQSDSLEIYSFDKNGKMRVEEGKKVQVPIENNDYLLEEYISSKEATVYKVLKDKDKIKNQYSVFVVFNWMEQLYEEYLNREPFNTLENRKEAIYKVCYDYVVSDEGYTMGEYKYSELDKTIQKDILKIYQNINYMKIKGAAKEESKVAEFIDQQQKIIKYKIFGVGRD